MRLFVTVSLFLGFGTLYAFPDRDARGDRTENHLALQSVIKLSFPKRSFGPGERIPLQFSIANTGKEVIRFFPASDHRLSFQLVVKDKDNRIISPIDDPEFPDPLWKRKTTVVTLVGDENKEIILHRHETFSKTIYLDEHYNLSLDADYFVTGYFYPNYTEDKQAFLRSLNTAHFHLQKNTREETGFVKQNIAGMDITPEETIFLFLGAEMKKNWESHFKWVDFPEYILAYDKFSTSYLDANSSERDQIVEDFKEYLTESPSGILKYFKVLSVDYPSKSDARVSVYVERMMGRFKTRYEYIYIMKKMDVMSKGLWQIKTVMVKVKK